jgi:hypothetical protein
LNYDFENEPWDDQHKQWLYYAIEESLKTRQYINYLELEYLGLYEDRETKEYQSDKYATHPKGGIFTISERWMKIDQIMEIMSLFAENEYKIVDVTISNEGTNRIQFSCEESY